MFGDPSAGRTTTRLLQKLTRDINKCKASGESTKADFENWRCSVHVVRQAVGATHSMIFLASFEYSRSLIQCGTDKTTVGIQDAGAKITDLASDREFQNARLKNAGYGFKVAMDKYKKIEQIHDRREAQLNSHINCESLLKKDPRPDPNSRIDAVGSAAFANWNGALSSVAAASISGVLLAMAANDAAEAEAELRRKREEALQLDLAMKKIALAIDGWTGKKGKLVSEYCHGTGSVTNTNECFRDSRCAGSALRYHS